MIMAVELFVLAWAMILLLIHIFAAAHVKTKQYGTDWNMGARDEALPPLNPVAGRLARAQANFQETLPIAIVALIGVVVAGRSSEMTMLGAHIWLGARILYLPVYALGIPKIRTLIFLVSLVGLGMVLWPLLRL
ncbi:Inner membrane protein [Sphingobium indicum BiD32]|uniref:Inner membrane protein n=2 Tax=Sphingobium indicum TaxID=332055 RepID=N1MNH5_9SPHN|nr:Inner membrane protein [Sphingobium indicum BiD32]